MEDVNHHRKRKQGDTTSPPRPNGTQQPKKGKSQARNNAAASGNSSQQQQQQDGSATQQPAQSGQQQAAHPAILYPNPFRPVPANVLSQQPPNAPGGQPAPLPIGAAVSGSTQPASVSTGQVTAPQGSNRPQQPAAQQQSDKKPKARALYASAEQMRQCGVTAEAETSLVLVLTAPTTERRGGRPAWSQLPKGNSNNPQSSNAIATLLAYLRVISPIATASAVRPAHHTGQPAKGSTSPPGAARTSHTGADRRLRTGTSEGRGRQTPRCSTAPCSRQHRSAGQQRHSHILGTHPQPTLSLHEPLHTPSDSATAGHRQMRNPPRLPHPPRPPMRRTSPCQHGSGSSGCSGGSQQQQRQQRQQRRQRRQRSPTTPSNDRPEHPRPPSRCRHTRAV